jgi:hypothetical protein
MKREHENDINCLNASGLPQPLGTFHRIPKHDTTELIPDDKFREMTSINQCELVDPKKHRHQEKPVLSMIHKYNIAELSLVDRPVDGATTGFGSVINRYGKDHDRRYWETSNQAAFGKNVAPSAKEFTQKYSEESQKQAGGNLKPFEDQKVRQIANLNGEIYSKKYDPQE